MHEYFTNAHKKFWDRDCSLPVNIPLGACGTYVHFVLHTF